MQQNLSFYLTVVFEQDLKTGDFTAFYAQFPDATSQGRTLQEAKDLLEEVFPFMMMDKAEEFLKYHPTATIQKQGFALA